MSWICANDVARPVGQPRLHADAERARRHRMRPDRRRGSPTTATTSSPAPASRRTISTGSRAHIPAGLEARLIDVTSALCGAGADGARARATCSQRSPATTSPTPPFRSAAARRSRSRARRCGRCASPTSANSAGSCTCRWSSPATVYDALMAGGRRARHRQRRLSRDRDRCGWRRAIAPGAPTSGRTTRRSRPASGWAVKLKTRHALSSAARRLTGAGQRAAEEIACARSRVARIPTVVAARARDHLPRRRSASAGWPAAAGAHGREEHRLRLRAPRRGRHARVPARAARYELEVATERVPCELHLGPLYDPAMARIKS